MHKKKTISNSDLQKKINLNIFLSFKTFFFKNSMTKKIAFLFLWLCNFCYAEYQYNLSVCVIFQNEAPYLKEWIEYNKLLGVEHFYFFNHYSTDNYLEVLKPYLQDGTVELKDVLEVANDYLTFYALQCKCYTNCMVQARGKSKWVAFIDPDEFFLPMQDQLLTDFLKDYEEFGGLAVNWLMFGTSNIKKLSPGRLLIESLTLCSEKNFGGNRFVKSIVRPERASHFENAHQPVYINGYCGVNTDKMSFNKDKSHYIVTNKLRINHYWTRDEDFFFHIKIPRQIKWGGTPDKPSILSKMNAKKDETILRYVPALKERVGLYYEDNQ